MLLKSVLILCILICGRVAEKHNCGPELNSGLNESDYIWSETTGLANKLTNIKQIMKWPNVAIVYDSTGADLIQEFLKSEEWDQIPAAYFNLADWRDREHALLITISKHYFPNISILLLGGTQALAMLNFANIVDANSNRTTDYRHKSYWIVVPRDDLCIYSVIDQDDLILENVAVMKNINLSWEMYTFSFPIKRFIYVSKITIEKMFPNFKYGFNGRHFIIASHLSPQFFLKSDNDGVVRYSGYAKTFSDAMSLFLNFTYTFVEPEDQQWGSFINGTWDGLIAQLIRREVDMVVAELTLTVERETVVDFVLPQLFTQGLGMVFLKEDTTSTGWLNILQPFQSQVYYTILAASVSFSLMMYFLERINPLNQQYESQIGWRKELLKVSNLIISVLGCSFLGSDGLRPRTCTGRLLTFTIWLFCLVVAATYSGNLTASLSVRREKRPFNTLDELVELDEWSWGVHPATLSADILRKSSRPDMKRAWRKILEFNKSDPVVLATSSTEHINSVINGKYAYITLDPLLFQLRRNDCLLDTVTNIVRTQHIAVAVSRNSPYKHEIQRFLFHLFDSGVLELWETARYKDKRPRECLYTDSIRPMYLEDIKGAFGALGLGATMACGFLIGEHIYRYVSKVF